MNEIWVIYSTFPNRKEAIFAARQLVERRLIACANIHADVTSIYRWEGAVQEEQEAALVAKTAGDKVEAAIAALKKLHSYQLPCITAYPVSQGFEPFLEWVIQETIA